MKKGYTQSPKPKYKRYARENRKKSTPGEAKLWSKLRNRRLLGYKFRRQFPIFYYILDFYCHELKLCIEVDGASHDERRIKKDIIRDEILAKNGIYTLRFSEYDVTKRIDDVLESISYYIRINSNSG